MTGKSDSDEEARAKSIASYRRLVDKVFANILHDTETVIRLSKSFVRVGEIVGNEEDRALGEFMTQLMGALNSVTVELRDRSTERFDGTVRIGRIDDEEWLRLDRAMENSESEGDQHRRPLERKERAKADRNEKQGKITWQTE